MAAVVIFVVEELTKLVELLVLGFAELVVWVEELWKVVVVCAVVMELVVVFAVDSFWGRSLNGTRGLLVPVVVEGTKTVADVAVGAEDMVVPVVCSGEGAVCASVLQFAKVTAVRRRVVNSG